MFYQSLNLTNRSAHKSRCRRLIFSFLSVVGVALFALCFAPCGKLSACAIKPDSLTNSEADQVRLAQRIDERMDVFARVLERRFAALGINIGAASVKKINKDVEKWGELKQGSPQELMQDVVSVLQSATDNIDDASTREPQKQFLAKALTKLQAAAARTRAQLELLQTKNTDVQVTRLISESFELIDAITAAQAPPPPVNNDKNANETKVKNAKKP